MLNTTQNEPGRFWLRCGECSHFVKTDDSASSYWCVNLHCRQRGEVLSIANVECENQSISREVA